MSLLILPPGYESDSPPAKTREVIRHINLTALPPPLAPYMDADRLRSVLDSAESGQTDDYFRVVAEVLQSDPDLMAALTQRKAAFIKTPWNLTMPKNPSLEMQRATDFLKAELEPNGSFADLMPHLPTGGLLPVAVAKWCVRPGDGRNVRWHLDRIVPAPWPLLDFSGNSTKPAGTLGIKRVNEHGQHVHGDLDFPELERYRPAPGWIVHRGHVLTDFPDAWGGPIRAALFWWFFGIRVRQVWVNYCERGSYFLEGQHEPNDTAGRDELLRAFDEAQRVMAIAVSADTNLKVHNLSSASGGQLYENFLKYAGNQCVKVVLGSTMTVNAAANGFGGNQGAVQADATDDVFQMDAAFAGRCIRSQLLQPLLKLNGLNPAVCPEITWGAQSEDQAALAEVLAKLKTAGIRPSAAALEELSGRMGMALEFDAAPGTLPPPVRTFAAQPGGRSRSALLSAAAAAGAQIDRAAAEELARAGRGHFAGLAASLETCETPEEASDACDSWLATFSAAPIAGALQNCCAAHAANGLQRSAAAGNLRGA